MNNKDQSQNDAVDNDIFTATPKTTETNESETKSDSISSVKRYVPHLRNKITKHVQENIVSNLERTGSRGERGPESGDKEPSKNLSDQQYGHSAENEANYELKPRDIRLEQELFPRYERDDNWQHNYRLPTYTIQVLGDDVPAPIQSLADIDLGPVITNNIALTQYEITSTQKYALPLILSGRDMLVRRPLGMAIIHAYLFAIIANLTRINPSPANSSDKVTPQCIILTYSRELAPQIIPEARKFSYRSHLQTCMAVGGSSVVDQIKELKHGCDILVATPGRLMDLIERGILSLANVKFLCLEEVDRMLDMGFEPQLRCLVEKHDMPRVGVRQTLLFSSTFPKEVQRLAQELMYDYILLNVNRDDNDCHNGSNMCTQTICDVNDEDKHNAIVDALDARDGLALVYVNKKVRAEELNTYLQSIGLPSTYIHGDCTQQEREEALTQFQQGIKPILVATNVFSETPPAAYIINYDMPSDVDSYVHRIRHVSKTASKRLALSFFSEENKSMAKDLVELLEHSDQEVPDWLREYAAEHQRDTDDSQGRGSTVLTSGRGGRGRGGSRGFGARARGRGYADNRFEPYGRGQNNTNNNRNGSDNEYSSNASNNNNNGNNDGGSQSSSGSNSNTNWW